MPSTETTSDEWGSAVAIAHLSCGFDWGSLGELVCSVDVTSLGSVTSWVADGDPRGSPPAWSPDASRIAFTDGTEIHVVTLPDGGRTNLTNHPAVDRAPAWSPNGAKIVFQSDRDGAGDLYVMNADGSDVVRLTSNVGVDPSRAHPDWSPDGSRIAFNCLVDSGNRDICRINADGSGLVRITSDPASDFDPSWSPDGRTIAFATGRYNPEF